MSNADGGGSEPVALRQVRFTYVCVYVWDKISLRSSFKCCMYVTNVCTVSVRIIMRCSQRVSLCFYLEHVYFSFSTFETCESRKWLEGHVCVYLHFWLSCLCLPRGL